MEGENHIIYMQIPKQKWDTMFGELKEGIQEIKNIVTNQDVRKGTKYTVREASKLYNVCYDTVISWIHSDSIKNKAGIISCIKEGRSYVITIDKEELNK